MRGLLLASLIVFGLIAALLAASPAHAEEPEPSGSEALAQLVLAGAPLTSAATTTTAAPQPQSSRP